MPLNRLTDSGTPLPPPDVQSTTFSLDAMARFTCNTWDEAVGAQQRSQFDVVVIGSGMYGGYTAAKLFEIGRRMSDESAAPRVLVLESGPFLIGEHIQNLTRRSTALGGLVAENLVDPSQTNEGSFVKHYRCVGGKSIFWGGWTPRYQPEDLERLDEDGERLWPASVRDYLFKTDWPGGYAYSEVETGIFPVQDFINGPLYEALKARAEAVVAADTVPALTAVQPPPIAVQGEGPGSGLFSFDKFSSVPLLLDSVREDCELAGADNNKRRLFLVPYAEALKLETSGGRVRQVVVALADPSNPRDKSKARIVRLDLKSSALVILAGNTINSTRLALNSFPRPAPLNTNGELMGRNLMYHTRSNYIWRVKRDAMGLPPPDPAKIRTAALHVTGSTPVGSGGVGQFHFQFYAAPNMDVPMFPGASRDPERFLYQMTPNIEDVESVLEAQSGLGNDRVVVGIRTVGESFGNRSSTVGSDLNVSWMNVNPFGGTGDDVYYENGDELRVPKSYVNLVKGPDDIDVWAAQDEAAFEFIDALAGQDQGGTGGTGPLADPTVEVLAQIPLNAIPDNGYLTENAPGGRFFVGRFNGQIRVLDGACTHEGCFVDWVPAQNIFNCPCHTAHFAVDGLNVSGPPPAPLFHPEFRVQNGMLEIIKQESGSSPVEFLGGGSDGIGSTYHECGTLWMGDNPAKSVTDAYGRFHHVTNAYCVDQSLYPTAGSANPVLTGIALSRRIADSIVRRCESVASGGAEAGFEPLYTGNFVADGWQIAPGGSDHFYDVADPAQPILGAGVDTLSPAMGVLRYTGDIFDDFILRLEWRAFDVRANSGIFLRMPPAVVLDAEFYDSTIEVQIDEHGHDHINQVAGSPLHKTGAVYGVFPARLWAAKIVQPRETGKDACWNSCEIRLEGRDIEVRVNGELVTSGKFPALLAMDAPASGLKKREKGFIGIQCHTEVVQFRNIRIKPL